MAIWIVTFIPSLGTADINAVYRVTWHKSNIAMAWQRLIKKKKKTPPREYGVQFVFHHFQHVIIWGKIFLLLWFCHVADFWLNSHQTWGCNMSLTTSTNLLLLSDLPLILLPPSRLGYMAIYICISSFWTEFCTLIVNLERFRAW